LYHALARYAAAGVECGGRQSTRADLLRTYQSAGAGNVC